MQEPIISNRRCQTCGKDVPNTLDHWYATGKGHKILVHRNCQVRKAGTVQITRAAGSYISPPTWTVLDRARKLLGASRETYILTCARLTLKQHGIDLEREQREAALQSIIGKLSDADRELLAEMLLK